MFIGSDLAVNSDSEPPPCVHEEGIYYASVTRSYNGHLPVNEWWVYYEADGLKTSYRGKTTTTATETAGTVFNCVVYVPLSPGTLQYRPRPNITFGMYLIRSPTSVVVPGTQQATNDPAYRYTRFVPLRSTVFVREYFL